MEGYGEGLPEGASRELGEGPKLSNPMERTNGDNLGIS